MMTQLSPMVTFIASGRPKAYLDPELLDESLFDGYVLMNGALVLYEGKALYHQPLPKETVKAITELCEQRGVEYILEGAEHTYLKRVISGLLVCSNAIWLLGIPTGAILILLSRFLATGICLRIKVESEWGKHS